MNALIGISTLVGPRFTTLPLIFSLSLHVSLIPVVTSFIPTFATTFIELLHALFASFDKGFHFGGELVVNEVVLFRHTLAVNDMTDNFHVVV